MCSESRRPQPGSACLESHGGFSGGVLQPVRCHNNNNNSVLLRKQAPGPPRLFPARVSCSSLARAAAISKPGHGKRLETTAKVNFSSSSLHPEGLGAALGDAQITENPSGMLRAAARQPGEVVKKTQTIFSPAAHGRKRFLSRSFNVLGWLLAGPAQPLARPELSRLWQPLLNYGIFIFFRFVGFYFNGNFTVVVKEIINSGCREAAGPGDRVIGKGRTLRPYRTRAPSLPPWPDVSQHKHILLKQAARVELRTTR